MYQINLPILFILSTLLLLFFVFALILVTDFSNRLLIFTNSLLKLTLFFLFGFFILTCQFSTVVPVVHITFSTINFVINLRLVAFLVFLIAFFLFSFHYFCGIYFMVEELIVFICLLFISIYAVSATDLISLFVCLEGLNLCLFILLLTDAREIASCESALKYVFVSMLTSLILLFGIVCVYYTWSTFTYLDLQLLIKVSSMFNNSINFMGFFGLFLIVISFIIKLGMFPFYTWMVNVYIGFSAKGLVFVTIISKTLTLFIFLNLVFYIKEFTLLSILFIFISIGSFIVSSWNLIMVTNFREFIVYVSLSSTSFIFIILFYTSCMVYLVLYFYVIVQALNLIFLFCFFAFFKSSAIFPNNLLQVRNYSEAGFMFFCSFCFVILSLLGIPPLAGFFPKLLMLFLLYSYNSYSFLFIFVFFTLISSFFFIRLLRFFGANVYSFSSETLGERGFLFQTRSFLRMKFLCFLFILFNFGTLCSTYLFYVF